MDHLKISDGKVKNATTKTWKQWFAILDKWQAQKKGHYLTAKYLGKEYGLSGWWSQVVTIRYEKEHDYWKRSSPASIRTGK